MMGKTAASKPLLAPGYIPQLDGLRGLAILLVLIGHSGFLEALPDAGMLEYARFGVDLFFVLSGFLVTGILLDSKGSEHYFRNFYARRALRIWPLYYVILFLAFVLTPILVPSTKPAAGAWPAFVVYIQNIAFIDKDTYPFGLGATWSLAVEEQFYLTWPVLVFLLRRRALALVSVSLIIVSLSFRLVGYFHGAPSNFVHQFTLSRLDAIALGSLAALWLRSPSCTLSLWRTRAYQFLAVGASGTVLARVLMHRNSSIFGYTFMGILFTGLLGVSLSYDPRISLLGRILSARWLRYVGRISYGTYLLHLPLFILWARLIDSQSFLSSNLVVRNLFAFAGQLLLVMMASSISWRLFEGPILRVKRFFPMGPTHTSNIE